MEGLVTKLDFRELRKDVEMKGDIRLIASLRTDLDQLRHDFNGTNKSQVEKNADMTKYKESVTKQFKTLSQQMQDT